MPKKKADEESGLEKTNYVRCRYCGQRNAVKDNYKNGAASCGKCKLPLSDEPHKKFADLSKHDYIHPLDSKALAALRAIPGIDTALRKLLSVTGEAALRVIFTASSVKVTPKQFPDLHAKLQVACTTLGVDMPELFVQQNPIVNAFTYGSAKHIIVLHSGLLERLDDEETLAVISHEVGHIHAEHALYLTAARLMEALANASAARLIPGSEIIKFIISAGINSALLAWARRAELSGDRAGLLVVQDPHVIGRVMMKLAGGTSASKIDYEQFLEQGREFKKTCDEKALDKFWATWINAGLTHPFPIWRVGEILDWVESGQYKELMEKKA
ncbi:MAG TPA: M48 family metallopeptidase [Pyrinomonadaceae bacterium]|jgi:Zn-dependent protease with chaperone function